MTDVSDDYEDPPTPDGLISFLKAHKQKYEREGRGEAADQVQKYIEWVDAVRCVEPDPNEKPEPPENEEFREGEPPEFPESEEHRDGSFPGGDEFMKDDD